jgi:hypothetical protein
MLLHNFYMVLFTIISKNYGTSSIITMNKDVFAVIQKAKVKEMVN